MNIQLTPRQQINSEPFIQWSDFLTDSDILKILSLKNWHDSKKGEIGETTDSSVNTSKRSTNISWFMPTEDTAEIWHKIVGVISEVNRQFFNFDLTGLYEPAQLGLYSEETADHYDWHIDSSVKTSGPPRKLTMVLSLSDPSEYEGGALQIMPSSADVLELECKKGRAWFFPSYTLHRVTPVTKGVRRSLVLWIGGPAFK